MAENSWNSLLLKVLRVCYNSIGFSPAVLDIKLSGDDSSPLVMRRVALSALCRGFSVEGGAAAVPGGDALHLDYPSFIPPADSSKTRDGVKQVKEGQLKNRRLV